MNILITGATGFIASQIVTDLLNAGHTVTCCARNTSYAKNLFPTANVTVCNFSKDQSSAIWTERLQSIDVVINCVGILYHPIKKHIWDIHYHTPKALFTAAEQVGVKRIIQISALGIEQSDVEYAKSKKAAEEFLQTLSIESVILRPSLVYGRGSYGGTSLFRGLTGLPGVVPIPGEGMQEFQPIYLQDLSQAVVKLATQPLSTKKLLLHAVGPQQINLCNILVTLRAWLGFTKAKLLFIPFFFIKIGTLFGDLIPYSAMNSTSYKMMRLNNITTQMESQKFFDEIGFVPRNFSKGLYSQPSTVQDHWHARLYFLKPVLQFSLAFVWLMTAIACLFIFPQIESFDWLLKAGVNTTWQPYVFYGASIVDLLIGLCLLIGYQLKKINILQLGIIIFYTIFITWRLPSLWFDPFAAIVKNIPLLVAILIFMALESDR